MKWKTTEEVKEAAKDKMSALEMSLKHHSQGRDCTRGELVDAIDKGLHVLDATLCACCLFSNGCCKCVLSASDRGIAGDRCCGDRWWNACKAWETFRDNPTPANFTAFQQAESKVCDYIQGVIDAEEEPKLRHGDIVEACGRKYLAMKHEDSNDLTIWRLDKPYVNGHVMPNDMYYTSTGQNIFDDLAKSGERLAKFEIKDEDGDGDTNKIYIVGNFVHITNSIPAKDVCLRFTPDKVQEICDNLQRVINKAKNKDGKK